MVSASQFGVPLHHMPILLPELTLPQSKVVITVWGVHLTPWAVHTTTLDAELKASISQPQVSCSAHIPAHTTVRSVNTTAYVTYITLWCVLRCSQQFLFRHHNESEVSICSCNSLRCPHYIPGYLYYSLIIMSIWWYPCLPAYGTHTTSWGAHITAWNVMTTAWSTHATAWSTHATTWSAYITAWGAHTTACGAHTIAWDVIMTAWGIHTTA